MWLVLMRFVLFGPIIVSGTLTCSGTDWVSDGSKCYKIIQGSPLDGQTRCSNEDPNAKLMLAPSSTMAAHVETLFSDEKIWVGLRYRNGAEWIWDNGLNEPATWGSTPILPQLCISVFDTGLMYDIECSKLRGLICQKDLNLPGIYIIVSVKVVGKNIGFYCFKSLRPDYDGVDFSYARILCGDEGAHIMMPKSKEYAADILTSLGVEKCWGGVTDFDADHIYTWEDGTSISQTSMVFASSEPNNRDKDYICAYIHNGIFYNHACTTSERVICEIDALDNSQTTVVTQKSSKMESTSAEIQITTSTSAFMATPITQAKKSTQLESTSDEIKTTGETSAIKTTPTTAFGNSQATVSFQNSTQTEGTSAKIRVTTNTSTFMTTPTTESNRSFPYVENTASRKTSIGPNRRADKTVTTVDKQAVQYNNATIMPSTFLGHTISAYNVPCVIQCISNPSEKINTINIPYKVDLKSLSSYRRKYKSADDPRMSSFYIGCVGIAVLVMSILFIVMLDCLPSA